ncbi:MAG: sirohydrochlorin cobaltochelatase [Deltaproteobacteria bacterium]|nr:sirohydrochlorin cobaltochelatase [Deltaproteobacteria bacterium]
MRTLFCAVALAAAAYLLGTPARAAQLLTRARNERPAIVLAAFGTSTRAQATYDFLEAQVRRELPDYELRWAFTSEIIRERTNARREKEGRPERLRSLAEVLAGLEGEGYGTIVVQPLFVAPGEEYDEALAVVRRFPSLRIEVGETLLHRWSSVEEVLLALRRDFLPPEEGCNVLVAHGSPTTGAASNTTLLGLERQLARVAPNAYLGCVEGVIPAEDALERARACAGKRVRFVPLMLVAGDHILNDVMGGKGAEGSSWRAELVRAGKEVDVPTLQFGGETHYKGLGFIPEVNAVFIRGIRKALDRL